MLRRRGATSTTPSAARRARSLGPEVPPPSRGAAFGSRHREIDSAWRSCRGGFMKTPANAQVRAKQKSPKGGNRQPHATGSVREPRARLGYGTRRSWRTGGDVAPVDSTSQLRQHRSSPQRDAPPHRAFSRSPIQEELTLGPLRPWRAFRSYRCNDLAAGGRRNFAAKGAEAINVIDDHAAPVAPATGGRRARAEDRPL